MNGWIDEFTWVWELTDRPAIRKCVLAEAQAEDSIKAGGQAAALRDLLPLSPCLLPHSPYSQPQASDYILYDIFMIWFTMPFRLRDLACSVFKIET